MPRKGHIKPRAFLSPEDPRGMPALMERYLEARRVRNYSSDGVIKTRSLLSAFILWCHQRGLTRPEEITRPILERYQRSLYYHRREDGTPLTFRTQYKHLGAAKYFFRWLTRQGHLFSNPAADLEMPRLPKILPRQILTVTEVETILAKPDISSPYGLRDRAILETLYSTGIRRAEVARLKLYDIAPEYGTLMVREGKGLKDRVVPIGERALFWVDKYVREVRPSLVVPPDEGLLFLTYAGVGFNPDYLGHGVRRYVEASGVGKEGACHLFRHTMATLMLEGGADVRFVQEMLGHARLTSTQIYTHVAIATLKRIHAATHPGARLGPRPETQG